MKYDKETIAEVLKIIDIVEYELKLMTNKELDFINSTRVLKKIEELKSQIEGLK